MIYLLIANEADSQEHKRDTAKSPAICSLHCYSFLDFQFTKDFLGKLGYSRKNPRSRGWGYTFLLTCMTLPGNSKIENQFTWFFFIIHGNSTFLVDPQEFPYALSSIPLEILWIAHYGMTALEVSRYFINYFVVKEGEKTGISFDRLLKMKSSF